ncbi:hypothetical protein MLD38_033064 [Melastoma candidum]|uniref:Uncharacterized protein n=2 Tax=Melastoma candidum TaxID=119954 RepID=A0ACB9M6U8_9MYRT|nr:hypothetical protein MLD38_033064 [Melastoma candidum]
MAFSNRRKGMYSWWWDSHISPKNSKWLQENLTDMDVKVKQMIKLIEEDADSFARRAEMYYKKRPELMKLVEEFYRAYRALAERYDHATGALRQAHKTMSEAFPNQVPLMLSDDSPGGTMEFDPRTPDMIESNDSGSQFSASKRNGGFSDSAEARARRGLSFAEEDGKEGHDGTVSSQKSPNNSSLDMLASAEVEIQKLKELLAELQVEKEAGLVHCQQSLEKSSILELELKTVQEECEKLQEQARLAEGDVQSLKDALAKLGAEKEDQVLQYHQCMEKVTTLENHVSSLQKEKLESHGRANDAEVECENLKEKICALDADKKVADDRYKDCLVNISTLEDKLAESEENARNIKERAEKAEIEVENLKEQLAKLFAEKETLHSQCQQCLAMISELEHRIAAAEEESERLNVELKDGMMKLKGAEEKCVLLEGANQTLHLELESASQKMANQTQELSEKQQELGNLWTAIQEERLRFLEAETAFQTLQHLHSKSQEELMSLNLQLQNKNQILNDMEIRNLGLEDEIRKVQQDNQNLTELNLSSSSTVQTLQAEILSLRETIKKFEAEIDLRVDERNALQQEIYCLKEELNDLNKKHQDMLDEKSELTEKHERECDEKVVLLMKLAAMEKLIEKNTVLENSLSDLNIELDVVREKVKSLEETCERFLEEKSGLTREKDSLISKLQDMTEKCDSLIEKNKLLENSLCDANVELEEMKVKLKGVEDSCLLLDGEKSTLSKEKEDLLYELTVSCQKTEELETKKRELEASRSLLEEEKESGLIEITKLKAALEAERFDHAGFAQSSRRELGEKELWLSNLQEELRCKSDEYEKEVEKKLFLELDLFILHTSLQDLGERATELSSRHSKLELISKSYQEQTLHLGKEYASREVEIETLTGRIKSLQPRLGQMQTMVLTDADYDFGDNAEQDHILLDRIVSEVQDLIYRLAEAEEEDFLLLTQNSILSTLLKQIRLDLADNISERNSLRQSYRILCEQFALLQRQEEKARDTVEELGLEVLQGLLREVVLRTKMKLLHDQLMDMHASLCCLKEQNDLLNCEKISLRDRVNDLSAEKRALKEEINAISDDSISQAFVYLVVRDAVSQKFMEIKQSQESMQADKLQLKGLLAKTEDEIKTVVSANGALNSEIAEKKIALSHTESRLSEVEQMLKEFEMQKEELMRELNNLRSEHLGLQAVRDDQHSQIQRLSQDHHDRSIELESTREAKQALELRLSKLVQENEEHKTREESTTSQLEEKSNEISQWEAQATRFLDSGISIGIREALLEEKIFELSEEYISKIESKDEELQKLKGMVHTLEEQNARLDATVSGYVSDIASLNKCVSSLESRTALCKEQAQPEENVQQSRSVAHDEDDGNYREAVVKGLLPVVDGLSELQNLQRRIESVEKTMLEKEKLASEERKNNNAKLGDAVQEIEKLKREIVAAQENSPNPKKLQDRVTTDSPLQKNKAEMNETENELLTKDIMLDQVSECSSYSISRRGTTEVDDQLLESRDTVEMSGLNNMNEDEGRKEHRSLNPSTDSFGEKELGIEKLDNFGSFSESNPETKKKKILERLDSDAQKLGRLQVTVEDMKRKVGACEEGRKEKDFEVDDVKAQLEDAEESITKLLDLNRNLVKNVEDGLFLSARSSRDLDNGTNVSRRRVSEQARQGYEKIGRLQAEVQKLQLLLAKLEDEKGSKWDGTRVVDYKTRVLLRDYLYGGGRGNMKRKKGGFCSCIRPSTEEH